MRWSFAPLVLMLLVSLGHADESLFDPDPNHVWNRLHRDLYSRPTPDGKLYDKEGLEPVFVRRSSFLTKGDSHQQALKRLDEFLEQNADKSIDDPLKRAILQRDLWAVFVATADPMLQRQPQRRELQMRLAQVMRRVALDTDEIQQLPDNLAGAVKSKAFPTTYLPKRPQRPFLPKNLLEADGPWVLLRSRLRSDDLAAPNHVRATDGRSTFLLFIHLPTGRRETLDYLNTLEELPPNTMIPQIPEGTQVALLRRMMLIDRGGKLRLTPLTESLQMRVYQELAAPDMYEFTLRRKDLIARRAGGLHATAADDVSYFNLGFLAINPHARRDPFETEFPPSSPFITPVVMKSCLKCHAGPGIFGFQSMFVDHFDRPPLGPTELKDQVSPVIDRTYKTYAWGLLQGFWETGTRSEGGGTEPNQSLHPTGMGGRAFP